MEHRRLGKFEIGRDWVIHKTESAAKMFALLNAVVVRVEWLFDKNVVEYIAISPMFDELPTNAEAVRYKIIVNHDADGTVESVRTARE